MNIERSCFFATKEVVLLGEGQWPADDPPPTPPPSPPPASPFLPPRPVPHIPVERWDEKSKEAWKKIKEAAQRVRWWLPGSKKAAAGSIEPQEEVSSYFQPSPWPRCPPTPPPAARPSSQAKRPRNGSDGAASGPSKKNGKGKRAALAAKIFN